MILHNDPSFKMYFGDLKDDCVKSDKTHNIDYFVDKKNKLNLDGLIFLKQTHSNSGISVDANYLSNNIINNNLILFKNQGDFLVTNIRNIGIGVLTADCLPIAFYDSVNHAIGVAHAGWRGTVDNIAYNTIKKMQESFGSKIGDITAYLGACAKVCCYQVQPDFLKNLENAHFWQDTILKKDNLLYFDLPRFVYLQLIDIGLKPKNICLNYNNCTICDQNFHSFRKKGQDSGRQPTIISLI